MILFYFYHILFDISIIYILNYIYTFKNIYYQPPPNVEETTEEEEPKPEENENDTPNGNKEEGELDKQNGEASDKEDDDDEDSDDDVNVVIGDIKATPNYSSLNIKRGGLLTAASGDKSKQTQQQQPGKFTVEEFDQVGAINGVPATDFNLDSLEDKPWRKPGADITDYFNYGFNEDTWRSYCERQKRYFLFQYIKTF